MLRPDGGVEKERWPLPLLGTEGFALGLTVSEYGLFFVLLAFLAVTLGLWFRFPAALEAESEDEELLRFAKRFIQFEKGRRRECLSDDMLG